MRRALTAFLLTASVFGAAYAHEEDFDTQVDSGWTAAERKSGHDHPLEMIQIRQLATINQGLNALAERDERACRWMNQIIGPETLARQIRAFDANPAVKQVIEAAQMSVRDYLLTLHAVSETAIAVHASLQGIQAPASPSSANIAFYRHYQAEIERLLDAPDPC